MPHADNFHDVSRDAVDDEIRRMCHDSLPRAGNVAGPADFGMILHLPGGIPHALRNGVGHCGNFFGDVLLSFDQVGERRSRPA